MPTANNWNRTELLAHVERSAPADGTGPIRFYHPRYPYIDELRIHDLHGLESEEGAAAWKQMQRIAESYLRLVYRDLLGPANRRIKLLKPSPEETGFFPFTNGFRLAWLPLGRDPTHSCLVLRTEPATATEPLDVSLSLLATQVFDDGVESSAFGSGLGIRVAASLRPLGGGCYAMQIDGVTCAAGLVQEISRPDTTPSPLTTLLNYVASQHGVFAALANDVRPLIAAAAGIAPERVVVTGVSTEPGLYGPQAVRFQAHTRRPDAASAFNIEPAYAIDATIDLGAQPPRLLALGKAPLIAHGGGNAPPSVTARLFAHQPVAGPTADWLAEPASQAGWGHLEGARPNRFPRALEQFRNPIVLSGLGPGTVDLQDPAGWFEVRQSPLVDRHAKDTDVQQADGAALAGARSNNYAAVSAYRQLCDLFAKIDGFGLQRHNLFRFLGLPLIVRHRATMTDGPGRDGKIVNAQVDFDPPDTPLGSAAGAAASDPRKPLQMRLALADTKRSASGREPLGIATDARWIWHEFGHVLLAGATGKLEFVFAHSAGDALAAIISDPRSGLAADPRAHGMRGATFPWVYLNRRHDRPVEQGWSWSGRHHQPSRFDPSNCDCRHKGYASEQILSTTLFRLYRTLGGDTVLPDGKPDVPARLQASDFTLYLIMRAMAGIGAMDSVNLTTVGEFAQSLMQADIVTRRATSGLLAGRVGGCAHKLVRWAFEQQGLYAAVSAGVLNDGPGAPPAVDVYIDDLRATVHPAHRPGGYTPVSLDWNSNTTPAWHASQQGMQIDPVTSQVKVKVGNRGTVRATGVRVSVWYVSWPLLAAVPPWNRATWTALTPAAAGPATIVPGATRRFGPFSGLPATAGRYLVLAEVHANEDRANTYNDSSGNPIPDDLPCSRGDTRLVDLVAGDNNLGLLLRTVV